MDEPKKKANSPKLRGQTLPIYKILYLLVTIPQLDLEASLMATEVTLLGDLTTDVNMAAKYYPLLSTLSRK